MHREISAVLDRIRALRIEKGLSILDLANKADISHSYLYYIESKRKVPTLTVLCRIAKALSVEMKDFFV
ncbi:MAG: helix-turn-helix domain-containing protein [Spirochaetales bacterium]|jgi:XRE family transcriptional regulator of biofilm formation|nr:helix-turn-helix domain-containing protein [Spirochaetales bacterium]MDR1179920.1 helix-turn-helix domain-containing protein [Spirochaetales bacterium]